MNILYTVCLLCALCAVSDGFFSDWIDRLLNRPDWNNLKVTWTYSPFSGFDAMPRTEDDARRDGFHKISECGEIPSVNGKRYMKGTDFGVVLLYGRNGYIAGIQIGVPRNESAGFPPTKQINTPFVLVGDMYFLTAYFTNPATVCTRGRTAAQYDEDGTGNALFIQNGTDPVANSITIPMTETAVARTRWTRGRCFVTMGVHYWYDVSENMSCDDFFPVFLLYNGGKLNAFGWAIGRGLSSPRLEHPGSAVIRQFIAPVPQCLLEEPELSTLHMFLTNSPRTNFC